MPSAAKHLCAQSTKYTTPPCFLLHLNTRCNGSCSGIISGARKSLLVPFVYTGVHVPFCRPLPLRSLVSVFAALTRNVDSAILHWRRPTSRMLRLHFKVDRGSARADGEACLSHMPLHRLSRYFCPSFGLALYYRDRKSVV